MASPEVNMQDMREVVIVTLPEPEDQRGEDLPSVVEEDKTLLLANDTREEVLVAAPDEAEAEGSSADSLSKDEPVVVKLSEQLDMEAEVFYPITCADVKASLVWRKFVCPGINVKCVQFNQQLISPKEFVCLAGKSTLKDWKRAIRLNGTMLRKIMDSGDLDFYQHTQVCSNTCRSTKIDLVANKVSVGSDLAVDVLESPASSNDLNGAALPDSAEEPSEWVTAIGEDAVMFWRAVKDAGLLEEVVEDFQTELQVVFKRLQERVCEPPLQIKDAELLHSMVQNFGLLDLVKKVLAGHKNQMDRYREQYSRSLAALEQQCDEHRKQAKELKNKSQHLNNVLMTLAPPPPPPAKRPRLTRAVSGPATVGPVLAPGPAPSSTHMSPQLPGLPLGKLMTVGGAGGGGRFTLLTSTLSGPELAPNTNTANLSVLSVAATPEGGAGGIKVLGPQFQVVTLPASSLHGAPCLQSVVTALQDNSIGAMDQLQEAIQTDGGQTDGGDGGQTDDLTDGGDGGQTDEGLTDGGLTDGGDGGQGDAGGQTHGGETG